jgi:SET domain-containing protein
VRRSLLSLQCYDALHSVLQLAQDYCFPMALLIRSSSIHAAGCYTTSSVRKGTRVAEYTGPRMTKDEADAANEESPITYLFGLGDGSVIIDGHCMAMFINHSCDPNCETEEVKGRVWIRAIRKIEAGEEITYDYCLYDGGEDDATCNCAAENCRGTMYSPKEVRRRKVAAKKPTRKKQTRKRTQVRPTEIPVSRPAEIEEENAA